MKKLKNLFENIGYENVETYLNSGNVFFESKTKKEILQKEISKKLQEEFGFKILTLIKTQSSIKKIYSSIPKNWKYNLEQYTQIAYLFPEIDSKEIINKFPIKKEFIEIKYIRGAIIWNVKKENYNKSHLNYVFNLELFQFMTIRNVNTAKFLAENKK